jgi:hypothetical protein
VIMFGVFGRLDVVDRGGGGGGGGQDMFFGSHCKKHNKGIIDTDLLQNTNR